MPFINRTCISYGQRLCIVGLPNTRNMATSKTGQTTTINGVRVCFPHKPYPSQLSMMDKIIKGIEKSQNCLLESPTGSGKSLALLCSALAWQRAEREKIRAEEKANEKTASCCKCAQVMTSDTGDAASSHYFTGTNQLPPIPDQSSSSTEAVIQSNVTMPLKDIEDSDFKMVSKTFRTPHGRQISAHGVSPSCTSPVKSSASSHDGAEKPAAWKMEVSGKCNDCMCNTEAKPSRKVPKIWFGTRTHKQIAQIARELGKTDYSTVRMCILSSREHTCIHPQVKKSHRKNEDCKQLLEDNQCRFYDNVRKKVSHSAIQGDKLSEAWDLEDFVSFCKKAKACPYFGTRQLKDGADIVFCPYNYLIDPLIRESMEINLKDQVVILDEAHNIEDSAREAASFSVTQQDLYDAVHDLNRVIDSSPEQIPAQGRVRDLLTSIHELIDTNSGYIPNNQYDQGAKVWNGMEMVAQLKNCGIDAVSLPVLNKAYEKLSADNNDPEKMSFLKVHTSTLKLTEGILMVLNFVYRKNLAHMNDYRMAMLKTLVHVKRDTNDVWLNKAESRRRGGARQTQWGFALHFWCLNPAVAFCEIGEAVRSIILTSGTLSPMSSFQSELAVAFPIQLEANHVVGRSQVWVGTIAKGPRGTALLGNYHTSETFAYQDDIGELVLGVCETVPHGVLCFLPSYKSLEKLTNRWRMTGLYTRLEAKKVVMSEPKASEKLDFDRLLKDFYDVINEWENYDDGSGRTGALFLAVCRGKVSEGMDFSDNNARAVITVGIPFPNVRDEQVKQKKEYNNQYGHERGLLSGGDWYEIQAYRALNQALGRCIRHRNDWGALILVDERFIKNQRHTRGLSKWVRKQVQHYGSYLEARQSLKFFIADRLQNPTTNDVSVLNQSSICASPGNSSILTSPATFKTPHREYSTTPNMPTLLPITASPSPILITDSPHLEKATNAIQEINDRSCGGGFLPASQVDPQISQSQQCLQNFGQSAVVLQAGNSQSVMVLQNGNNIQNVNENHVANSNSNVIRVIRVRDPAQTAVCATPGPVQLLLPLKSHNSVLKNQIVHQKQIVQNIAHAERRLSESTTTGHVADDEGFIEIKEDDFQPKSSSTQLPTKSAKTHRQAKQSRSLGSKLGQLDCILPSSQVRVPTNTTADGQTPKATLQFDSPVADPKPAMNKRLSLREKLQNFQFVPNTGNANVSGVNENWEFSTPQGTTVEKCNMEITNNIASCLKQKCVIATVSECSEVICENQVSKLHENPEDELARSESPDLFDSDAEQMTCDSELDAVIADVKTEIEKKGNTSRKQTKNVRNLVNTETNESSVKDKMTTQNLANCVFSKKSEDNLLPAIKNEQNCLSNKVILFKENTLRDIPDTLANDVLEGKRNSSRKRRSTKNPEFEYGQKVESTTNAPCVTVEVEQQACTAQTEYNTEGLNTRRGKRRKVSGGATYRKKKRNTKGVDFLDHLAQENSKTTYIIHCMECQTPLYNNICDISHPTDMPHFIKSKCQGHAAVLLTNVSDNTVKVNRLQLRLNKEYPVTSYYSESDGCCYNYVCCKCGPTVVGVEVKLLAEQHHQALQLSQVWLFPKAVGTQEDDTAT